MDSIKDGLGVITQLQHQIIAKDEKIKQLEETVHKYEALCDMTDDHIVKKCNRIVKATTDKINDELTSGIKRALKEKYGDYSQYITSVVFNVQHLLNFIDDCCSQAQEDFKQGDKNAVFDLFT